MFYRDYRIVFSGIEDGGAEFLIIKGMSEIIYKTNTVGNAIKAIDEIYKQMDLFRER